MIPAMRLPTRPSPRQGIQFAYEVYQNESKQEILLFIPLRQFKLRDGQKLKIFNHKQEGNRLIKLLYKTRNHTARFMRSVARKSTREGSTSVIVRNLKQFSPSFTSF